MVANLSKFQLLRSLLQVVDPRVPELMEDSLRQLEDSLGLRSDIVRTESNLDRSEVLYWSSRGRDARLHPVGRLAHQPYVLRCALRHGCEEVAIAVDAARRLPGCAKGYRRSGRNFYPRRIDGWPSVRVGVRPVRRHRDGQCGGPVVMNLGVDIGGHRGGVVTECSQHPSPEAPPGVLLELADDRDFATGAFAHVSGTCVGNAWASLSESNVAMARSHQPSRTAP